MEEFISPQARSSLDKIRQMLIPEGIEPERHAANGSYVADKIGHVKSVTQDISSYGLTDEQAKAVATDEDVTLVLAGAGTGKTVVITSKIAHLVRNQDLPPEKILVLAFNRDAAQEIRERLPADLQGANVLDLPCLRAPGDRLPWHGTNRVHHGLGSLRPCQGHRSIPG